MAAGPEKNDKKPILEKLPKKRKCTDMPQSTLHKFVALMGLVMFLCDLDQGHEGYVKVTWPILRSRDLGEGQGHTKMVK